MNEQPTEFQKETFFDLLNNVENFDCMASYEAAVRMVSEHPELGKYRKILEYHVK